MVDFAGHLLPVQYEGVIAESNAVRKGVGMFDVSHMARLELSGPRTLEFLEWVTTNDVAKLKDGTGQYSLLPNSAGGLVDDVIVYRVGPEEFKMVVNASNHSKDVAHLKANNHHGASIEDVTRNTAMVAVQGPASARTLATVCDRPEQLQAAPTFGLVNARFAGVPCVAARSGYTGEDGFELVCSAEEAQELWQGLLAAGVAPCGLGSRDTLRVEAGLPLYGHELGEELSPVAAGLGWVIGKTKEFVGSGPINKARAEGTAIKLQGVRLEGKRLPQPEMAVYIGDDRVGTVTSGVYSPLLECGVAFAFVSSGVAQETNCTVDVRGSRQPARIVNKRFFKRI